VLGWAWLVRGAAHPGTPYRPWAFDHHAYSDLLAMGGDRYFAGGRPLPYLEDRIEYPPLLGLVLWLPSFAPGGPAGYFTAGWVLLAACALASVALLGRLPGASPWWLAANPALAYYGALNWDLFPIALFLVAVLAFERGRAGAAGAWAGLGAAAKLWPVALAPPAMAALARRRAWKPLAAAAAGLLAAFLAVNAPVALAAPARWAWFWTFNAARGAENSFWELFRHVPGAERLVFHAPLLNALTAALLAAAVAFAAVCAWRGADAGDEGAARAVRLAAAFVVLAWISTAKVWSPQYALWAAAAGAMAAAPRPLLVAHAALAVVDYHVAFETRSSRGWIGYYDAVYTAEELLRLAGYAWLLSWIGRALWRASAAAAPAGEARG
jgi:hypothetical protein